jgi:uncharacterized protein YegL
MTEIFLALLLLLAAWVGGGMLLLARDARRRGSDYQREVKGRVYSVGDGVEVVLRLVAPATMRLAEDHDVVLAIDHSGSMGAGPGSPLREATRAAENFIRRLPNNMHVAVIGFDHEARLLCRPAEGKRGALRAVGSISSGGGTAIHAALDCSREALSGGRPGVAKTIVLLSDGGSERTSALGAARLIHESPEKVTVVCVGFGPDADGELLRAISSGGENYFYVKEPDNLNALFGFLASSVSGQMAVAGLVDEGTWSPHPFRLASTGGLYPIGVQPENPTRVVWSVPVMDDGPVPLTYNLVPLCPGWHDVAAQDGKASWHMPDGTKSETRGPAGPHVLVMPRLLRWAWPLLNPLFWMIFGRFWPCPTPALKGEPAAEVEPLPTPTLPALLPAPPERPYEPAVRPALVVGLGDAGERTVCNLKERLQDRRVDASLVDLVAVRVTHKANRLPVKAGRVTLCDDERVELHQDLRPYLETLRGGGAPPTRAWVPWREWLAETQPLTTVRTIADDRRMARLALLRKPEPLEARLAPSLRRVVEQDGIVVLVGARDDPECSGLLAEVAHVCAEKGAGVTAVFTPSEPERSPASVLALARELERMVLMSGRNIVSDRHEPPKSANKLFDRIVVLEQRAEDSEAASRAAAELLWAMLAYKEVFRRLPALRTEGEQVFCSGALIDARSLPAEALWRWVRERTLAAGLNVRRMGLTEKDGRLELPRVEQQTINGDVEAFWSGQNCRRPRNLLLDGTRAILYGGGDPVSALLTLQEHLPVDSPYHEQVSYSLRERRAFAAYLEEWCQYILEREQNDGGWGIRLLLAAVVRVEDDFESVVGHINRLAGNADFATLINFASAMCADFLSIVSKLRANLAGWLAALVGPQPDSRVHSAPEGRVPVCHDIEGARAAAEEGLRVPGDGQARALAKRFDKWYVTYGDPLIGQLRFRAALEPGGQRLEVKLRHGGEELQPEDDLSGVMRGLLDRYRNVVLSWPLDDWLPPENVSRPLERFRVGKHSRLVYRLIEDVADEEDPFTASAILVRERRLDGALGAETDLTEDLPYAWPEEANAARIARKIRNRLNLNPHTFSPAVVHLMRDTRKLQGFLGELARGSVVARGEGFALKRDGREYAIGPADERLRGLEAFQQVVQRVIDGEDLPPPAAAPANGYEETLRAVEAHPLGKGAAAAPEWRMWRDLIRGLALEDGD